MFQYDYSNEDELEKTFLDGGENIEFPVSVSWLAGGTGGIEGTKPKLDGKCDPHFMHYLVEDELADAGSSSEARSSSKAGERPRMELAAVCQNLPEDLIEAILLRLPVAAQARCRAVCKKWLAMLSNPEFARLSFLESLSRTPSPLCAIAYCPVGNSHNPYRKNWPPPILPSPGPLLRTMKVDISFLPEVFHSGYAYGSPCGFVCIASVDGEGTHLCVVNPMNKSFKVLPMLQQLQGWGIGLMMGTETATQSNVPSFKVWVYCVEPIGDSDSSHRVDGRRWRNVSLIYSSVSGEWKGFLSGKHEAFIVACNGGLYTTLSTDLVQLSTGRGPRYLWKLALPLDLNVWQEHPDDDYSEWGLEFRVVAYRGRLLCCHYDGIWMLDDARELWVKISGKYPFHLLSPRNPEKPYLFLDDVRVAGDLVIFCYQFRRHPVGSDEDDMDCPIAYNMIGRFWLKVPQLIAQRGLDFFEPMPDLRL